jgi:hypothetical protein
MSTTEIIALLAAVLSVINALGVRYLNSVDKRLEKIEQLKPQLAVAISRLENLPCERRRPVLPPHEVEQC